MGMTLYEINAAIRDAIESLFSAVNEETGEVDEEKLNALEQLKEDRAEKLDNIGAYIKNLIAEVEALKQESATLKERADVKAKKIERLKKYVADNMLSQEETKFESKRVVFSFRKSEQVEISDDAALPKKYLVKKVEYKPDKAAIKEALKGGSKVNGAKIVEKQNLQIK